MKRLIGLTLLAAMFGAPALADCTYPKAPAQIPDGNTAALEEMVSAKKSVEAYNKDMDAYLACIKLEADAAVTKGGTLTEDQKKQLAAVYEQKNNAAVDELQTIAARLNEQIRVYKAKHPPK